MAFGPQVVAALANTVYSETGVKAAQEYLGSRGILPDTPAHPCSMTTDADRARVHSALSGLVNPERFQNCLFIPITAVGDPTGKELIGFCVRYQGEDRRRARFDTVKLETTLPCIYNMAAALRQPKELPIIVAEACIDAMSIQQATGYVTIAPLGAHTSAPLVALLLALSERPLLMFDNDEAGAKVTAKTLEIAGALGTSPIISVPYRAADPNKALTSPVLGAQHLRDAVAAVLQ